MKTTKVTYCDSCGAIHEWGYKNMSFSGGEQHVIVDKIDELLPPMFLFIDAFVRTSDDLMTLLILKNAIDEYLVAHDMEKPGTTLFIPYLPYARQDRVTSEGSCFSLKVMASIINSMDFTQVAFCDVHSEKAIELINNSLSVCAADIIEGCHDSELLDWLRTSVVVAPDKGAINRATEVAEIENSDIVYATKHRDAATGKIVSISVDMEPGRYKRALIVDDICDGGATFSLLAEKLSVLGVDQIALYVTHGIFKHGVAGLSVFFDKVFTTDSFCTLNSTSWLHILNVN